MKINLVCRFNHTGMGRHAENFTKHFLRCAAQNFTVTHVDPDDKTALAQMLMNEHPHDVTLFFNIQNPKFLQMMKGRKILWFVFESSRIPSKLIGLLHDYDKIWTPSGWGYEALVTSGLPADKIDIMPEGVDADAYYPAPFTHDGFSFLALGKYEKRKGLDELVQAFKQSFPGAAYPDVLLKLKVNFALMPERRNELKAMAKEDRRLVVYEEDQSDSDIIALYNSADAFIFPSRAEGFGLPCLEALACGVPVAAIAYSGQSEYLKTVETLYLSLPYTMEEINDSVYESFVRDVYAGEPYGQWARPDIKAIGEAMQQLYEHANTWKKKALQASSIVREQFHWRRIAERALVELQKFA